MTCSSGTLENAVPKVSKRPRLTPSSFCQTLGSNEAKENGINVSPGKPVSATWIRKDGTSGSINYQYLMDASGRRGILSTKYLKNRKFNDNLKNIAIGRTGRAIISMVRGHICMAHPTLKHSMVCRNRSASEDGSRQKARAWEPVHVGVLQAKSGNGPHHEISVKGAELVTDVHSASDWSYTASRYHLTNARICGDAGSFIDPLFSSGIHLTTVGGLSAAVTIAASIRGDCDEEAAGSSHSKKTVESYTRVKVIQGTVDSDTTGKVSQNEVSKVFEFCYEAFIYVPPEKKDALFAKSKNLRVDSNGGSICDEEDFEAVQGHLTTDEVQILEILRSRRMMREGPFEMDSFTLDTIDGVAPNLVHGELGLVAAKSAEIHKSHFYSTKFLTERHRELEKAASIYQQLRLLQRAASSEGRM
ncbi:hypothetical protein PWT90_09495 [Aphanocladium album]|nr:hypothetical protein PWT90_09495 [Aphanocladium album]